jgi:hypothetical protein
MTEETSVKNKKIKDVITTTIRMPRPLWRKLKTLIMDGKIKSLHQAFIDGVQKIIKEQE